MKKLLLFLAAFMLISGISFGQITVSGAVSGNGTYGSLTNAFGAFAAINGADQTGAAILIQITADVTTEAGTTSLTAGTWATLTINPIGTRTISGSVAGTLINLSGAGKVTIDGLKTGGNTLTISNSSTAATAGTSTIRFINDASGNTVTNCTILGSTTGTAAQDGTASSPSAATILFGASSGSTGNDNNTISNSDIGPAGTNLPFVAISSAGQSTSISNDNNTITGNNIFNFYCGTGSAGANGIAIGSNSSAFTISNNRFYETASRSGLGSSYYWEAIFISTASGGGYTISGNTIGYASNTGTGMLTNSGGRFVGIDLTAVAASPVSNIQGNTINGINWTTASGAATAGAAVINGIIVKAGGVNIGTTTGNTIGATTGTGNSTTNIFVTSTSTGTGIWGIYVTSATAAVISNNTMGAIATSGTAAIGFTIAGIQVAGTGSHTITSNTIGNSTANNIAAGISGTTTAATVVYGIYSTSTGTTVKIGDVNGTGNIIQNTSSNGSAASSSSNSSFFGIINSGIAGTLNINYNTISNNDLLGGGYSSTTGYYVPIQNSVAITNSVNINYNTISGIISKATYGGSAIYIFNITGAASTAALSISNNVFSSINFAGATGSTGGVNVIYQTGTPLTEVISNNNFNNISLKSTGSICLISNNYSAPANGTKTVQNNFITTGFNRTASGSSGYFYGYYDYGSSPSTVTHTISGNNFSNVNTGTSSSSTYNIFGIYSNDYSGSNPTLNCYNNTIGTWSIGAGTGAFYGLSLGGFSGTSGSPNTVYGNTVSNLTSLSTSTSQNGINIGSTNLYVNIYNNTVSNCNINGAAGQFSGIYGSGTTNNCKFYNNTITGLASSSTSALIGILIAGGTQMDVYQNYVNTFSSGGSVWGIYVNGGTTVNIYQQRNYGGNNYGIYGLSSSGVTNVVEGIRVAAGTTVNVYQNNISGLSNTSSSTTATYSLVNGLSFTAGTTVTAYNNIIGNLTAPAVSYTDAIHGISITSATTSTTYNVYYNTVYLTGSGGTNFGSSGIYHAASATATTAVLNLRNNIIVNNCTPAGTGLVVAFRRSAGTSGMLANYASTSNNNLFYAGAIGAFIYHDGTGSATTMTAYKTGVFTAGTITPRDAVSISENPNWVSTAGANAGFLHINTGIATGIESGAATIATYNDDYDADARYPNSGYPNNLSNPATAPDMGADEFAGIPLPLCTGTPASSTINGVAAVCTGTGTTLSLSTTYSNIGITYQWASSITSGGPYTTILGTSATQATGNLAVTTYFICTITCTNSGYSYTTVQKSVAINPLPSVSVTPTSASYCTPLGSAVALTAGGANTYAWNPAAGLNVTTGQNVNAGPASTTTYTVVGTDGNGCTNSATSAITVGASVTATATATPSTLCSGNNSQLLATGIQSFTTPAPSAYGFAGSTRTYSVITGTTLTVSTTDDDGVGNLPIGFSFNYNGTNHTIFGMRTNGLIELDQASATLSSYSANVLASTANCIAPLWDDNNTAGGTMIYTTTGNIGSRVLTAQWTGMHVGGGGLSSNPTIDVQIKLYETTNKIEFIYGSTSAALSSTTASIGISGAVGNFLSVTPLSPPNTSTVSSVTENTTISSATNFPSGTVYTFTPTGAPVFSYSWTPATFISGQQTLANPLATAVTSTTPYTVTITGNAGCSATANATVTVSEGAAIVSQPSPSTLCAGQTATFTVGATGPGLTYQWRKGGLIIPVAGNPSAGTSTLSLPNVSSGDAANYDVVVGTSCGSPVTSDPASLTVKALPPVTVTPTSASYCIPGGSPIALLANGATSYTWSPAAGLDVTTGANVNANPSSTTTFIVTGTGLNGCTNTASSAITVGASVSLSSVTATPPSLCYAGNTTLLANASLPTGTYCQSTHASGCSGDDMIHIVLNTLNSTASACGLSTSTPPRYLYTTGGEANTTKLSPGGSPYSLTITFGTDGNQYFGAWIDYNQDGIFDATEFLGASANAGSSGTISVSFTVPGTAMNGTTRLRIVGGNDNPVTSIQACGASSSGWGETQDYDVTITGAVSPLTYLWSESPLTGTLTSNNTNPASAVNVTENNTYTVVVTAASGCTATGNVAVTVGSALSAEATALPGTSVCNGTPVTLNGTPTGGGGPYTYSWKVAGLEVSTLASFSVTPSSNTTYDLTITDNCSQVATASVTITVKPVPVVTAVYNNSPICSGSTLELWADTDPGATYNWTGPNGFSSTSPTPEIISATTAANGGYSLVVTLDGCSSGTYMYSAIVNPTPAAVIVSPASATVCAGTIQPLVASGGAIGGDYTFGTGAFTTTGATTGSTLGPNPMQNYYGGTKQQMIFTADELSAAGISPGPISALTINLDAGDNTYTLLNYTIKMGHTLASSYPSTSSWTSGFGLTTVRNTASYTPQTGLNTLTFDVPFEWNGVFNIVVEMSFSNSNTGTSGTNTAKYSNTAFTSTLFYRADNTSFETIDAYTSSATESYNSRTDIVFTASQPTSVTWSPVTGLYTDLGAGTHYTGSPATTVYAKPALTTSFTATATSTAGCMSTASAAITVKQLPDAPSAASPQVFCITTLPTVASLTPSGSSIKWYDQATNGSLLSPGTLLANGIHYYASQTVNDCEGTARADVLVTLTSSNSSDHFRTKTNGNWSNASTWESSANGTDWCGATLAPTNASADITILNGNTVTVDANVTASSLAVNGILVFAGTSKLSIDGVFTVPGTFTYGTGKVEFNGTVTQLIPGLTFYDLIVNNPGGLTLAGDIDVVHDLTFTIGIVTTGTNKLLVNGAITGASASAYVNGKLARVFNSAGSMIFPIGKGGNYRPLTLNYASLDAPSTVTAEQFESALPGTIPPETNLYTARYWSITQTGAVSFSAYVTLDGTGFSTTLPVQMLKGNGVTNTGYYTTTPDYTNVTPFTSFSNFGLGDLPYIATTTTAGTPPAIIYGTPSTNLTANVSPNPGGGSVLFYVGGNYAGTATVDGSGNALLVYDPGTLDVNTYTIRADFSGYYQYPGSSSAPGNNGSLVVNPKELTVTGITANNKPYDGNTTATLNTSGAIFHGIVAPDVVTLNTSGASANFDTPSAGTGKPVTVTGLAPGGPKAGNYTLVQPTGLTADILNITGPVTTASAVSVCSGITTVDIPITVSSFNAVGSISLKLAYNNSKITAPTLVYEDPGLTAWQDFLVYTGTPGTIIVSGGDPSTSIAPYSGGLSLSNGATLFTLRFTIQPGTTSASLTFVENAQGTSCEYAGVGPDFVPFIDTPTGSYYIAGGVTVTPLTSIAIQPENAVICSGTTHTFTVTAGGTPALSYQWYNAGGPILTANGASFTTGTAGSYYVVVHSACGPDIESTHVTLALTPQTAIITQPESATICKGTTNTFSVVADGTQPITYQWFNQDGLIPDATAPDYTAYLAGTYYVVIYSACGIDVESSPVILTVHQIYYVSVSIAADVNPICQGSTVTFTATPIGGGSNPLYEWYRNSELVPEVTGPTYTFAPDDGDEVFVVLTSSEECSSNNPATSDPVVISVGTPHSISGNFTYYNNANTPLKKNVTVQLFKDGSQVGSDYLIDNPSGHYEFASVCPGTYEIRATSGLSTDGSVNTTDASQVNVWGAHPYLIEKVRFYAGDVTGDLFLNSTDAQRIQYNFVYGTPFNRPPWTFWIAGETISSNFPPQTESYPTITIGSDDVIADIYGLCTGDFNRSFTPGSTKSVSQTLDLIYSGDRQIGSNQEFDLPVRVVNASTIGAVSLILNFPAGLAEVQNVTMNGTGGQLDWNVNGNELRIGWNSQTPLDLGAATSLLTLRMKTTAAFTAGNSIRLTLAASPLNELANGQYNVIPDAVLSVETVGFSAVGINNQPGVTALALSNHPNPFNGFTTITYALPFAGNVKLEIRNLLGVIIKTLVDEVQAAGEHSLKYDAASLEPGIYTATIRLNSDNNEVIKTIKLVSNR